MIEQNESVHEVDVQQVKKWLDADEVLLIDVREPGEYKESSIHGAHLLPLSNFSPEYIPDANGKHIVVHCKSGGRSAMACEHLMLAGMEDVWNMTGGILAWKEAGLESDSGQEPHSIAPQLK